MRFGLLASALSVAVIWVALGFVPTQSQAEEKAASCQACGQSDACPHCAADKDRAHCTEGKACPHCKDGQACPHSAKGKACTHCGKGRGLHGKWGSHKWDYKCVRPTKKPEAMSKQFSGLGEQGWRLIEADGGIWCFSRMRKGQ